MASDPGSIPEPPTARVGATPGDRYAWIAEPTAELIGLLDAERAYYEARTAPLAELRALLAAEMTARVPDPFDGERPSGQHGVDDQIRVRAVAGRCRAGRPG